MFLAGGLFAQPALRFEERVCDLGEISPKNGLVVRELAFENTGDEPLVLLKAEVACTCTRVRFPRKPVLPGGKGTLTVSYDPRRQEAGPVCKAIRISANTPERKHVLTIRGTVVP